MTDVKSSTGITDHDDPVVKQAIEHLVQANRILAHEGVLDAYGHVSLRHPTRPEHFLQSRSRSPELVEPEDIIELGADGEEASGTGFEPYWERHIHAGVYELRPDVMAVCHNHALPFLPFTISQTLVLRPVVHMAAILGGPLPLWNIADEFGDATDLLVRNIDHGRSMAKVLGEGNGVLMRAHGSTIVGHDVRWMVGRCIELFKSAKVQLEAERHGPITEISQGELDAFIAMTMQHNFVRTWEYWCRRAGLSTTVNQPGHEYES